MKNPKETANNVTNKARKLNIVTSIAMTLTITIATLSVVGVVVTGFYPGIIVLLFLAMVTIGSKLYALKIIKESNGFLDNFGLTLLIINLIVILVVLWMTMVIVHDRVLKDCC